MQARTRKVLKRLVFATAALILVVILGFVGFVVYRLKTTRSGVYHQGNTLQGEVTPPPPGTSAVETIVYTSVRPSAWDIFLFESKGGEPQKLTDNPNLDYNARFSPDGRWIVFTSERGGNADLFALDLEKRGEPVPLTRHPAMDDAADISPDGKQIVFVSSRSGNPDIFQMPFEPGNHAAEDQIANLTSHPAGDFNPAWSPDGKRIAFASNRSSLGEWNPIRLVDTGGIRTCIFTINADESDLRQLGGALASTQGDPAWSDDGQRILFYKADTELNSHIREININGSAQRRLSPEGQLATMPCPGPNGGFVYASIKAQGGLARFRGTSSSLIIASADGATVRQIDDGGRFLLSPDCHAASGRIVCHGNGTTNVPMMANGRPFTWPAAERFIKLPDRVVRLKAIRGYFPSFANDGSRIFDIPWIHEADGIPAGPAPVISARFDGTEMSTVYLPPDDGFAWTPVVTQNGQWIFFSKGPRMASPDTNVDIWKVRSDGTGAVNLTADCPANDAFCDVSADGSRVVFRSGRHGDHDVFLMDGDGKNLRRLCATKGPDTMPAISPDGRHVCYVTARAGAGLKLWLQSLDEPESAGRLLEPGRAELDAMDMHPRFSPDGKWVVFTSVRGGMSDEWLMCGFGPQPYGELFAVPVDGKSPAIRLTNDKWEDGLAFWGTAPRQAE